MAINLIQVTDSNGNPIAINPNGVIGLTEVPGAVPPTVIVRTVDLENFAVPGTIPSVVALLGGTTLTTQSKFYNPTLVASGGGVAAAVGSWKAIVMPDVSNPSQLNVLVRGTFGWGPAVAGVAEVVKMSLPSIGTPPANFVSVADAQGGAQLQGLHAATDFCDSVQATVGAKTVEVNVLSNAASSPVNVCFSYTFTP